MRRVIQEKFGQALMDSITNFAQQDILSSEELERTRFSHVDEIDIRKALADTMYGARWLYKIGLALLVKNEEQYAHVRAQAIDYASVCETLLGEMIIHGIIKNHIAGTTFQFSDYNQKKRIHWTQITNVRGRVEKMQFWWGIQVARENSIITPNTAIALERLKDLHNTVHITEKVRSGISYYIGITKSAYAITNDVIDQTIQWKNENP